MQRFAKHTVQLLLLVLILLSTPIGAYAACQVTLQWKHNPESDSIGYRVYMRQADQSFNFDQPAWQGQGYNCTIAQLDENTAYFFTVRTYHLLTNAESDNSNEVRFVYDASPPRQPELLAPANNANNVALDTTLKTSSFFDQDADHIHANTRWQVFRAADDLCVLDFISSYFLTELVLPPLILDETTTYYWTARHYNQDNGLSESAQNTQFTTTVWLTDDNANGIPDSQELVSDLDLDNNNQADFNQSNIKCIQSIYGNVQVGVSTSLDHALISSLESVQAVDHMAVTSPNATPTTLPIGLINFKILVNSPGANTEVKLYFSNAIPNHYIWFGFDLRDGYSEYDHCNFDDKRQVVTLYLQDGGQGDLDGVANGRIINLSGYGRKSAQPHHTDGSNSSTTIEKITCFIGSLFN